MALLMRELDRLLFDALSSEICSAIALRVSVGGKPFLVRDLGYEDAKRTDPVTASSRFDLASVSKALSTALLATKAVELGLVSYSDRIPSDLSESSAQMQDLLRHTSGLPAMDQFYLRMPRTKISSSKAHKIYAANRIIGGLGEQIYSDVGFVVLGFWLERLFKMSLQEAFLLHIATPLGLREIDYNNSTQPISHAVVTEWCPLRKQYLRGIVHHENGQILGGVLGSTGLFGTASDVAAILESLLGFGPEILKPESVNTMLSRSFLLKGSYVLGWDTPSGPRSNAGKYMKRGSTFGHLGFTGTSIWVDRSRQLSIVFLTNRVFPSRDDIRIRALRPAVHNVITQLVDVSLLNRSTVD